MKLSIIVPVYNMAEGGKVEYCLNSILRQSFTDFELIIVDDASTDKSYDILKKYAQFYPKIVTLIRHEMNKRQGGAKNTGLSVAKGEWVSFIDSDDWIAPDFYEKLFQKATETGADVVGCNYSLVTEHTMQVGRIVQNNTADQCGILDHEKHGKLILRSGSMVIKIYKRDVIEANHLDFPEGIFYEDNCAGPYWSLFFTHFARVDEPLYYYYQHDTSTVHHISLQKCEDRCVAARIFYEKCKEAGFFEEYHDEIEYRFTELFFVNTLFSYLLGTKHPKLSFVKWLCKSMENTFPTFEENPYYQRFTDAEEKQVIAGLRKHKLRTFMIYRLKTIYRGWKNKRS